MALSLDHRVHCAVEFCDNCHHGSEGTSRAIRHLGVADVCVCSFALAVAWVEVTPLPSRMARTHHRMLQADASHLPTSQLLACSILRGLAATSVSHSRT